jgi:hypothetical protein
VIGVLKNETGVFIDYYFFKWRRQNDRHYGSLNPHLTTQQVTVFSHLCSRRPHYRLNDSIIKSGVSPLFHAASTVPFSTQMCGCKFTGHKVNSTAHKVAVVAWIFRSTRSRGSCTSHSVQHPSNRSQAALARSEIHGWTSPANSYQITAKFACLIWDQEQLTASLALANSTQR